MFVMIRDVFLTYFGGSLSRETAKIYYIYISICLSVN
jgi:hypothetical protein